MTHTNEAGLQKLHEKLIAEAPKNRKDYRSITTFTIDPFDAKDFDDALSVKKLDNGNYEIGIHIADVSAYVLPQSELDERATKRATSVYYADHVDPMLPEILSNDLCSLKPHVDRLAFSVIVEMDLKGKIHARWFGRTIIHSDHRFTYESAAKDLENEQAPLYTELKILKDIGEALGKERRKQGSIDFAAREIKCVFDTQGKLIDIVRKQPLVTHKLVEEFMLLANVEVAQYIARSKSAKGSSYPVLFRLHDTPDPDKLAGVIETARSLGVVVPQAEKITPSFIQKLLKSFDDHEAKALLHSATLRSMAKAVYGPEKTGHFGLAFKEYAHFTSPIRRFPDVITHRLLQAVLDGKETPYSVTELKSLGEHCTAQEIEAQIKERESLKKFQVQWMRQFVGMKRTGKINGVTNFGIFIEDDLCGADGLIHITKLPDDRYEFKDKSHTLKGKRYTFRLGDLVTFVVRKADTNRNLLDYGLEL